MDSETRLARLRADIAAGTYAPPAEAVAESLVGWIARPEQFEGRSSRVAGGAGDRGGSTASGREERG